MKPILDHYYLYLNNNCYAVVVGNTHSNSFIVGYIKYCRSSFETIWCNKQYCYDRLVKKYSRDEIYNYTPWKIYIPCYGSEIPVIPLSAVSKIYNPRKRVFEIIEKPRDELEKTTLDIIMEFGYVTRFENIGLTGTILINIYNTLFSDIDLVIYGLKESRDIVEFINENPLLFKELSDDKLKQWCLRVSSISGVEPGTAYKLYRRWRRGVFSNREYSIIYNNNVFEYIDNCEKWITIGVVEGLATIESSLDALNYPTKGLINKWIYINGIKPRTEPEYILSFEALYTPLFYEGGKCIVKGILQYNPLRDKHRLLIGIHEQNTYIKTIT